MKRKRRRTSPSLLRGEGRGRRGTSFKRGSTNKRHKKDLSHVQCYVCREFGHFASQCTQAKKGFGAKGKRKEIATSAKV